ncbi:hypothetical protein PRIPAC_82862 [Pristionchus pacificus]|uniref:Uncharacterized protein n=1 Tax=Pristionchus pacificus TaxID=54126 RepID=A0A2A6CNT2_PRIPA|nr:hypothetical protein PRIPAC_82862 [Pristionchus pacificus]|eukprot:PDM79758.1 hypothetical protein PRIPAC_32337 [Pristionchus pacificus]
MRLLRFVMILSLLSSVLARNMVPFKPPKDLAAARELLRKSRWMHHPLFPKISRPKEGEKVERLWLPYYAGLGKGR